MYSLPYVKFYLFFHPTAQASEASSLYSVLPSDGEEEVSVTTRHSHHDALTTLGTKATLSLPSVVEQRVDDIEMYARQFRFYLRPRANLTDEALAAAKLSRSPKVQWTLVRRYSDATYAMANPSKAINVVTVHLLVFDTSYEAFIDPSGNIVPPWRAGDRDLDGRAVLSGPLTTIKR